MEFRVATLLDGQDPDSFVSEHGPEKLEELLSQFVGLIDFALAQKLIGVHASASPDLISGQFLPWIAKISDQLKQTF